MCFSFCSLHSHSGNSSIRRMLFTDRLSILFIENRYSRCWLNTLQSSESSHDHSSSTVSSHPHSHSSSSPITAEAIVSQEQNLLELPESVFSHWIMKKHHMPVWNICCAKYIRIINILQTKISKCNTDLVDVIWFLSVVDQWSNQSLATKFIRMHYSRGMRSYEPSVTHFFVIFEKFSSHNFRILKYFLKSLFRLNRPILHLNQCSNWRLLSLIVSSPSW